MYYFIFSKIMDKVYIYREIDDYDLYTLFTKSKFVYFNVVIVYILCQNILLGMQILYQY